MSVLKRVAMFIFYTFCYDDDLFVVESRKFNRFGYSLSNACCHDNNLSVSLIPKFSRVVCRQFIRTARSLLYQYIKVNK